MYLTGAGKTKKVNKCGTKRGRNGKKTKVQENWGNLKKRGKQSCFSKIEKEGR